MCRWGEVGVKRPLKMGGSVSPLAVYYADVA